MKNNNRLSLSKLFGALLILQFLTACSDPPSNNGLLPDYVERSGQFARPGPGGTQIYWDKDRVVFVNHELTDDLFPKTAHFLHAWESDGSIRKLRDDHVDYSCFDGKNQLTRTFANQFFGGPYEAPKSVSGNVLGPGFGSKFSIFDRHSCQFIVQWERSKHAEYMIFPGFGRLQFSRGSKDAIFIDSKGEKLSKISNFPFRALKYGYADFIDRFFVIDYTSYEAAQNSWEESGCVDGFLISKQGDAARFCIPKGPWSEQDSDFLISNNGIIAVAKGGNPGLFWIKDDMYNKLFQGSVRDIAVSKDGCKIAVVHQSDLSRKGFKMPGELIKFNICTLNMEDSDDTQI